MPVFKHEKLNVDANPPLTSVDRILNTLKHHSFRGYITIQIRHEENYLFDC